MKKILVVIDMQNDFIGGALGSPEARAVVPAVEALIARKRADGADVVFTLDTHGENYLETQEGRLLPVKHCIRGTAGHELAPRLKEIADGAPMFEKGTFGSTGLAEYINKKKYEEITLCGVCTDICVVSNALLIKAFCPEATVCVAEKACAGTTPLNHAAALATMRSCQISIV